jgi:hypothetical protein
MGKQLPTRFEPSCVVAEVDARDLLVDDDRPPRLSTEPAYVARMLPEGLECASD